MLGGSISTKMGVSNRDLVSGFHTPGVEGPLGGLTEGLHTMGIWGKPPGAGGSACGLGSVSAISMTTASGFPSVKWA